MPLEIVRNDITLMQVDAIVNAANGKLTRGGGVCGAIFAAAGADKLQAACDAIGHCDVGAAVLTGGYALPATYIIHTVGPVWQGGSRGEEQLLRSCYASSLRLARERGCASVAFPLISSGLYGYPPDRALQAAIGAIGDFLLAHDELTVYLVVYDRAAYALSDKLFRTIATYIDDRYVEDLQLLRRRDERPDPPAPSQARFGRSAPFKPEKQAKRERPNEAASVPLYEEYSAPLPAAGQPPQALGHILDGLEMPFSERLLKLIDEKGKTDVEVYKRANIDRKLFSKIRNSPAYKPSKTTAIAFAVALELSRAETDDLLNRAGYALSRSSKFDLIVEYFIQAGNYNIFEINEALFAFDQDLLGV